MLTQISKNGTRRRVHDRIRKKVLGTAERPRLNVYRSLNHIYVQVIDYLKGVTLVSASTAEGAKEARNSRGNVASANTVGKTIADQLLEHGRSWKTYQESLPIGGADGVNYSDGFFTNLTNFNPFISSGSFASWKVQGVTIPAIATQADAQNDIVLLYAAKHNPFVYFRDVQEGTNPRNSLQNVVGFEGPGGLYQDLG